jgi:hypothetical protein
VRNYGFKEFKKEIPRAYAIRMTKKYNLTKIFVALLGLMENLRIKKLSKIKKP